jgi:molybdate transport system ATP-binding protein
MPVESRVRISVRALDVMLAKTAPVDISALNVMSGVVVEVRADSGPVVDVRLDCSGETLIARLTRYSMERLDLKPGAAVFALIKSVAVDHINQQ